MSEIRVDNVKNEAGTGAPTFPNGVQVTGVSTTVTLNVGTGGTVITTTSAGLVGIGTTNPRFKLEVGAVGTSGTSLHVNGDTRITGILSIGQGTITLDGSNNQVNVGTGVTLHHTNGVQVGGNTLHSTVLTVNQINASGVVTATSFSGALTGNVTGNINSSGISTLGNTVVGGGTTQLVVTGNARITGILTIGTSSITLDGSNNQVNVGSATTISITGFNVGSSNLHSTGLDLGTGNVTSHNINSTGIITASQFRVGTAVTVNSSGVTVTGVITATSFSGDGTNLTNTGSTLSAASGSQRVVLTGQTSGTMTASATSASLTFAQSTGTLSATSFSGSGANLTGITSTSLANNSINKEQIRNSEITNSKLADESITASKFIGNSTTIDLNRKAIYLPRGFYVYGTDASVPAGTDLSDFPYGEGYNWDGYTTVSGYVVSGSTVTARNINNTPNGLLIIEMTKTPSSGGGPYGNITGGGHEIWSVNTSHHGWSGGSATLINAIGTLHGSYTTSSWYGIYITGGAGGTYYRVTFIH